MNPEQTESSRLNMASTLALVLREMEAEQRDRESGHGEGCRRRARDETRESKQEYQGYI